MKRSFFRLLQGERERERERERGRLNSTKNMMIERRVIPMSKAEVYDMLPVVNINEVIPCTSTLQE